MKRPRPPYAAQLECFVDEVLFHHWDPIQINDTPAARDEYSSYAEEVTRRLLENATANEVAAFLGRTIASRMMVVGSDDLVNLAIGQRLVAARDSLVSRRRPMLDAGTHLAA